MKKLLFSITKKDFTITWFSGTGAGGQHRNKHQNCCRIKHNDSGVIGTGQSHKERRANQLEAFKSLHTNPKFKLWLNRKIVDFDIDKEAIEVQVEQMMNEKYIKIEYFN